MQRYGPPGQDRDVDMPISAGATSRQPPAPTDWLAVQEAVKQLYVVQELPLREVKDYLEQKYDFRASERMFKDRLKKWGYLKNLTREDWIALAVLNTQRKQLGRRSTVFVVRGRRKTVRDLQKYARSQSLTEDGLASIDPNIEIPGYLRALTPEKDSLATGSYRDSPPSKESPSTDDRLSQDAAFLFSPLSHDCAASIYSGSSNYSLSSSLAMTNSTMATSMTVEEPAISSAELPMASSWTSEPASKSSCEQISHDVEAMGYQVVDPAPLRSRYGVEDIKNWVLINGSLEGADPNDFDCSCSTCHQPSTRHFVSLCNTVPDEPTRNILNDTEDGTLNLPATTKEDGAWKWVALCFLSCIHLFSNSDWATKSLKDASDEFEKLVLRKDRMLLTAAGMTIAILHAHDQGEIAMKIMKSAESVVKRLLPVDDPLRVTIVYLTASADSGGDELKASGITSENLHKVHAQLNADKGRLHPYTIAAFYNYSWLLRWEGNFIEAEKNLRQVYSASCSIFTRNHMQSITALATMAISQMLQGKEEEAAQNLEAVIRDCEPTLGKCHPYRLEGKRRLALLYEKLGRKAEMEPLYWEALEGRVKMLGKKHPYTLGSKKNYEELMHELGRWDAGVESRVERLFREDVDVRGARSRSGSQGSVGSQYEAF